MKKQHTPGPWSILEQANDARTHISNGAHIVCTLGTTRTDGSPNHYANASLIASAPELLDALNAAYNALAWPDDEMTDEEEEELLESIRAALRKAKGE